MNKQYNNRIVKKTRRDGKGLMVSLPTGEGNYIDTWLTVNGKTVLTEGITDLKDLFNKKIDIDVRETGKATFLNKAVISAAA